MNDDLKAAFKDAEPAILLMVYVQLSGDAEYLELFRPHIGKVRDFANTIPPDLIDDLHDRLAKLLDRLDLSSVQDPDPSLIRRMMDVCVGEHVSEDYVPMLMEDLGYGEEQIMRLPPDQDISQRFPADFRVVIVGAGFSGLCAAIHLRRAGIEFDVFDRNSDVGGTWLENRYPGCGVDTANHWYSFSFALNPNWSRYFVKQPELQAYLADCAKRFDIMRSIHFNTEAIAAEYDEASRRWTVTVRGADGATRTIEANALIAAAGQLNNPAIPSIDGADTFDGPIFHTARWPEHVELDGKRVAMIGFGASGMQVGPAIAPQVRELKIFQRSAQWINQRVNYNRKVADGKMKVLAEVPFYARWYRFQLSWAYSDAMYPALQRDEQWDNSSVAISAANDDLRKTWLKVIEDNLRDRPDLLAKATPSYPPFGKRPLLDANWFTTIKRDNVELITDRITRITRDGIETADGVLHPVDIIIYATGFSASKMLFPIEIKGRDGHTIRKDWGDEDPRAHLGITVPNFPNLFVMFGPNTNYAHGGSIAFNLECQARYIMKCLALIKSHDAEAIEVRQQAFDAYNKLVDDTHARLVWTRQDVSTWYKNSRGRVTITSPFRLKDYWELTRIADPKDFVFIGRNAEIGAGPRTQREADTSGQTSVVKAS